tara:strand:+ start:136 stop:690 length:555 start_codon:yes stop_codon:yes gene_type:complete
MEIKKTHIKDLFIIEHEPLMDQRGSFLELWNFKKFKKTQLISDFSQDNISISKKNVIRGLHLQKKPHEQLKYVKVISGKVLDVAVDLRIKSKTFGQHLAIELSESNNYSLWIPKGFAHGFMSMTHNTIFYYKCYGEYKPESELTIKWDDPEINIDWGEKKPIVSKKDQSGISFKEYLKLKNIYE